MLKVDNHNNIKFTHGDYAEICFNLVDEHGEPYVLLDGETVKFGIKLRPELPNELITKTTTNAGESFAVIILTHDDTKDLKFGTYWYNIRLISSDGKYTTPMQVAKFELLEVV